MNRRLTALFAAFEALLVVAIGVGIPLAPLTVLWGAQFGFGVDWGAFWRASVDIWLIGHGVDVTVTLDPATAAALGYPGAGDPFTITIAALGLGMLTLMLAVRAGRRVAETRYRALGQIVALATFAGLSFGVTFSSLHPPARSVAGSRAGHCVPGPSSSQPSEPAQPPQPEWCLPRHSPRALPSRSPTRRSSRSTRVCTPRSWAASR